MARELRFEMDRLVSYDDASLLEEVRRAAATLPDGPITTDALRQVSRVSISTLRRRFGGWRQTLDRAGLGDRYGGTKISTKMRDQRARAATADDMIAELRRVAKVVGRKSITRKDLLTHSELIGERAILNRFGSWRTALETAGLELASHGRRWTETDYFENLLETWTHYGRAPTYAEMNLSPSRISNGGYAVKFGTWGRAKQAFVERVNRDIQEGEREATHPRVPSPSPAKPRQEDQAGIPIGLRYQVLRRDRFRCVTCGRSPATDLDCVLHVDHVVPFSAGGKTRFENLRSLCQPCNVGKGTSSA